MSHISVFNNVSETYSQETLNYITDNKIKTAIHDAANALGISATAIAGAIAKENNDYNKQGWANKATL